MSSLVSLIFYIISFLLSVFFIYIGNKENTSRFRVAIGRRKLTINAALIAGVSIPILVAGFRHNVGTDFGKYIVEYDTAIQTGSYLEASFNILANLSNDVFGSPTFLFITFSALTVVPVLLGINKSTAVYKEYRWLFWFLFLFITFPQSFNLLRQGAAVSIGFYLIVSIIESRKLLRLSHIMYLLLAVSFHASAWLLIPISYVAHLLNNKRQKKMILFVITSSILIVIGFSILPQLLNAVGSMWSGYLEAGLVSRSVVPRSLLIIFILLVSWKFYNTLKISNSYIALLWVGLLINIGGLSVAYFERTGYYITLLLPLLVLVMISQVISKDQARIVKFCICLLGLTYFVSVYYLMGSSGIFPYNWNM